MTVLSVLKTRLRALRADKFCFWEGLRVFSEPFVVVVVRREQDRNLTYVGQAVFRNIAQAEHWAKKAQRTIT